jgi:hypothetical protein
MAMLLRSVRKRIFRKRRHLTRRRLRYRALPVLFFLVVALAWPGSSSSAANAGTRHLAPPPPADQGSALTAVAISIHAVDLTWLPFTDESVGEYVIYRDGQERARVGAPSRMYSDIGLQPSTTYRYTVKAIGVDRNHDRQSSAVIITTPAAPDTTDITPPTEPEDFTATATGGTVLLDWYSAADDTDVTAYRIHRNARLLTTVNGGTLAYSDTTVQPNATYSYVVEAFDVAGNHTASDSVTVATLANYKTFLPFVTANGAAQSVAADMDASASVLAVAGQLRRYPYLTDVVGPYATINWGTDRSASTGSVKWGKVGEESCTAHTVAGTRRGISVNSVEQYQWKALLTLRPGEEYCYRVYLGAVDLLGDDPSPRFRTQVPSGSDEPFSFVVVGDWGFVDGNGANPHQANLMQQIAASGARFALSSGDNGYPSGSQTNYGDLVQTGVNLSGVFGPAFWKVPGASIPNFPVMGNHGFSRTDTDHPHLLNWPQDRAVATSSGRYIRETYCCLNGTTSGNYPSTWYAFDAGVARFYVLETAWSDSNVGTASSYKNDYDYRWTPSGAEYQWLEQDLATHPAALKFAFFHYPLYSDNTTETSNVFLQGANSLEGLLNRHGVDIAFTGHSHVYQRNHKPHEGSLITYVTGGGGAKLQPIGARGCSSIDAYGIGWSYSANGGAGVGSACGTAPRPTSLDQVFHFLRVHVDGTMVTVTPTDSLGRKFDVVTYELGDAPDTEAPSAPTDLRAIATSATRVELAWTAAADNVAVTKYAVYRDGILLDTSSAGTTFVDATVIPATTYAYDVKAQDAAGNQSDGSNVATVTTPAGPTSVFSDDFESGNLRSWTSSGGLIVQTALTHGGTRAAQGNTTNGNTYAKKTLPSTYSDVYTRMYFNLVSASNQVNLLRLRTASDSSIAYLFVNTAGQLGLRNDAGSTTITSAITPGNGWHSLELHARINGSTSTTEVWLDGSKVDALSRTMSLGSTPVGRLQVGEVSTGRTYNVVFDDVVVATVPIGP